MGKLRARWCLHSLCLPECRGKVESLLSASLHCGEHRNDTDAVPVPVPQSQGRRDKLVSKGSNMKQWNTGQETTAQGDRFEGWEERKRSLVTVVVKEPGFEG